MPDKQEAVAEAKELVNPPIVVNPNPVPDQLASTMRIIGILIGGITALAGFMSKRDLNGAIEFLRSSDAYPFIGAVVLVVSYVYGQLKTRRNKAKLVVAADAAPNSIAIVQGSDNGGK